MHPGIHAQKTPDKPAYVMAASGESVTYRELDETSNQGAQLFRSLGLAARRPHRDLHGEPRALLRGLLGRAALGPLLHRRSARGSRRPRSSTSSTTATRRCSSPRRRSASSRASSRGKCPKLVGALHGGRRRCRASRAGRRAIAALPDDADRRRVRGRAHALLVGHHRPAEGREAPALGQAARATPSAAPARDHAASTRRRPSSVYLSPAPLYHAAPLGFTHVVPARSAGPCIVMEHFDAEQALALIEKHRVTHTPVGADHVRAHAEAPGGGARQVRRVEPAGRDPRGGALPDRGEGADDRVVGAGALRVLRRAPRATASWRSTRSEWLQHKGSVGRALNAKVHIVDDDGKELPIGEVGTIYFESAARYEYHKDPGEDGRARAARRAGPRSATSATSTPKATCTSPIARPS